VSDGATVNDLGATGRRVRQVARAVAPCSLFGECSQVCPSGIPLTAMPPSTTNNAAPGRLESPADSMLDAAAKAVRQADPITPWAGLLPDVDDQRATWAVVAKAVYRAAVEDNVGTKTHDSVVQAIFDTKCLREYDQRALQ
jgi:L-lactate utilization protein LutB